MLLFKRAKELYPDEDCQLIVAVQDSDYILKYKPDTKIVYNTDERLFMVEALKWVDEVLVYRDVDDSIQNIEFDVFVKGEDQQHAGFYRAVEWCKDNGKVVITMPRTQGISSTMLRQNLSI